MTSEGTPSLAPTTKRRGPPGLPRPSPKLTYKRASELLDYDPATGSLIWRVNGNGRCKGARAGCRSARYRNVSIDNVVYKEHRVIHLIVTGRWPRSLIDHCDGNGHNNAWENLREADHSLNSLNRKPGKRNSSGTVGVCFHEKSQKWRAFINHHGKHKSLGRFECKADAVAERCRATKHFFGAFAQDAARYPVDDEG